MDRRDWDARYAAHEMLWGAEPNRFVAEALAELPARGRALDVACGEGRNAVWLAQRGLRVVALDFSRVALARGAALARARGVRVGFALADVTTLPVASGAFALALLAYLQVPRTDRRRTLAHVARALAPGGLLFGVGHALRNRTQGVGGPSDPAVLWEPEELAADLREAGLGVDAVAEVARPVETEEGSRHALDLRIRARRPGPGRG